MKAHRVTRPRSLETVELPLPRLNPARRGQIVVRTAFVSICGSDIPFFAGTRPGVTFPLPAGAHAHECTGQVHESTSELLRPGDWVVAIPDADLGLAEFFVTHETRAARLSSAGAGDGAACLIQPLATVMYAADRLDDVARKSVAVVGLGSMGQLFCWLLRRRGARTVVGIDPLRDRSDSALRLGADQAYPVASTDLVAEARRTSTAWDPPMVCIEAVGHQQVTLNDCIDLVREQGTVVAFGVPDQPTYPLAFEAFFRKNAALIACVTPPWASYLPMARDLFDAGRAELESLLTHRYPMRDAAAAFAAYERHDPGLVKVVLDAADW